jgi:hypothetical protein
MKRFLLDSDFLMCISIARGYFLELLSSEVSEHSMLGRVNTHILLSAWSLSASNSEK